MLMAVHICIMRGCNKVAKLRGNIGSTKMYYCQKHSKDLIRILDFLIYSRMRHKITTLMKNLRDSIFKEHKFDFCPACEKKLKSYIRTILHKIENENNKRG